MFRNSGVRFRLIIVLGLALMAVLRYCASAENNPTTGERQYVALSTEEEIQLGLNSAPEMEQQFGGVSQNSEGRAMVEQVGMYIIEHSEAKNSNYAFSFTLLADPNTINAFALPGGPVFITEGLYKQFSNVNELAGVLSHEIAHVVARHSSEQLAKQELTGGLTNAAVIAAGDYNSQYLAQMIYSMVNMKFSRNDELQADNLGVKYMIEAGYDPNGMIQVMKILDQAAGGSRVPEFQSTHPNPGHRIRDIEAAIEQYKDIPRY